MKKCLTNYKHSKQIISMIWTVRSDNLEQWFLQTYLNHMKYIYIQNLMGIKDKKNLFAGQTAMPYDMETLQRNI